MATYDYNTRIKLKRDTSSNWTSADPVILNGEIILVDTAEGQLRAKIGDGTKTYSQLPFTDETLRALISDYLPLKGGTLSGPLDITDTTASTSTTTGALVVDGGVGVGGEVYATAVHGAVWNDFAEFRQANSIEPGRVVIENGDDTMSLSTQRLQLGGKVISDTFGFSIGRTKNAETPVAVAGRVLAYTQEDREIFRNNIGRPVCSGENGTISIMSEEEERLYPSAILGYVSSVPDYSIWEDTGIAINGRIWIYVR